MTSNISINKQLKVKEKVNSQRKGKRKLSAGSAKRKLRGKIKQAQCA